MNNNIQEGRAAFDTAIASLDPLGTEFTVFETDYIDPFRERKEQTMERMNGAFIGLFAGLMALAIVFFLFSWFFVGFEKYALRYVAHVAWHIITLITIPLFLLASAFGLLGTAFVYLPPFTEVVLSQEGLKAVVND